MKSFKDQMAGGFVFAGCALVCLGMFSSTAQAGLFDEELYVLSNHPDGNQAPPQYGLRLDELFDITDGHDVFTFDFNATGAQMFMELSGTTAHIFGRAFGGLDAGNAYDPAHTSFVDIDFTYTTLNVASGDDDLIVLSPDFTNSGTITWLDTNEVIDLYDFSGNKGFTFRLGDEKDDDGHRGFAGISGWGWLSYGQSSRDHVSSSDFIFTATPIPFPPAVFLGAVGLLGLATVRKLRP